MLTGVFRGFFKELIALCVWGIALWLGFNYSNALYPWLSPYVHNALLCSVLGFVLIVLAVVVLGAIINALLSFIIHRTGLSGTDRLLGLLFGFVRGILLVAFIMVVVEMTTTDVARAVRQSLFYRPLSPVVRWIAGLVPAFIQKAHQIEKAVSH
jgi:membrane protein required for colicin V production